MMKKLFSGGGNDKSNWLGKVLHVGKHQCLIEEIIAEGIKFYYDFLSV